MATTQRLFGIVLPVKLSDQINGAPEKLQYRHNCDEKIFRHNEPVALLYGEPEIVKLWVRAVADMADAHVDENHCGIDFHHHGEVARVLYRGDRNGRLRIEKAIDNMSPYEGVKVSLRAKVNLW